MPANNIAKWDGSAWSPLGEGVDGPVFALAASGADLYLWDIASGRLRKRLQGHQGYINGLKIFDGGRKAVTSLCEFWH